MLTKIINIVYVFAVAVLLFLFVSYPVDYKLISGAILLFFSYNVWGIFNISANVFLKSMNREETDDKQISFTFDDGPDVENTPKILEILKNHNIKAAFFLIGTNIEKYPEMLRKIDNEDHIIGNHSYSHDLKFTFSSSAKVAEDLVKNYKLIQRHCGKRALFFRPPFGVTNPSIAKAVKKLGYQSIGWSCRSLDTKIRDSATLLKRLKRGLKPGAVFLFHVNSSSIVNILDEFIVYCLAENYSIVRIDKLFEISPYDTFN